MSSPLCLAGGWDKWGRLARWTWRTAECEGVLEAGPPGFHRDLLFPSSDGFLSSSVKWDNTNLAMDLKHLHTVPNTRP